MAAVPPITVPVVLDWAAGGLDVCDVCGCVVANGSVHDSWHGSDRVTAEPTGAGTVVYDANDVSWQRDHTDKLPWRGFPQGEVRYVDWGDLFHPLYRAPRALRRA